MTKPLLEVVARFDINEQSGLRLDGRAYLTGLNLRAYHSDLVYAVQGLREIIWSKELSKARETDYPHTVAIMWGDADDKGHFDELIDFFFWKYDRWEENAEIRVMQTRNGKIGLPNNDGSYPATCEGGEEILHIEKEYRRSFLESSLSDNSRFRLFGPMHQNLHLRNDFSYPKGRIALGQIMQAKSFLLDKSS